MLIFVSRLAFIAAVGLTVQSQITSAAAQTSAALAMAATSQPVVEYHPNESGGRVKVSVLAADSVAIEAVRQELLESAAAIRRGDFQSIRILRNDLPAVQVLARLRAVIRCTVRIQSRGGELVLLSDDNGAVAAIHQLLAAEPPRLIRL